MNGGGAKVSSGFFFGFISSTDLVIPAQAGIQFDRPCRARWIPACAGMTEGAAFGRMFCAIRVACCVWFGETIDMRLLPRSRRGTWLLAGAGVTAWFQFCSLKGWQDTAQGNALGSPDSNLNRHPEGVRQICCTPSGCTFSMANANPGRCPGLNHLSPSG